MNRNPLTSYSIDQNTRQDRNHVTDLVRFFEGKLNGVVLNIGAYNLVTKFLNEKYGVPIYHTSGDLDTEFSAVPQYADVIIYSHVIEHQFNPLFTLMKLRSIMNQKSRLYIILPSRGKLLWSRGHYHEIDHYRMKLLIERAGMEIVKYERIKTWRSAWDYLKGVRPLLRLFFEYNAYYTIKL